MARRNEKLSMERNSQIHIVKGQVHPNYRKKKMFCGAAECWQFVERQFIVEFTKYHLSKPPAPQTKFILPSLDWAECCSLYD